MTLFELDILLICDEECYEAESSLLWAKEAEGIKEGKASGKSDHKLYYYSLYSEKWSENRQISCRSEILIKILITEIRFKFMEGNGKSC